MDLQAYRVATPLPDQKGHSFQTFQQETNERETIPTSLLKYMYELRNSNIAMFHVYKHCNCNANVPTLI